MIPTKKEFADLIDHCNKDRLGTPSIDFDDIENSIYQSLLGLVDHRKRDFKNYINHLPAYKWLTGANKESFNNARKKIKKLAPITKPTAYLYKEVARILKERDEFLFEWGYNDFEIANDFTVSLVERVVNDVQLYERWIANIAECLTAYHYPRLQKELSLKDYKKRIEDARESLILAIKNLHGLEIYGDSLYFDTKLADDEAKIFYKKLHQLDYLLKEKNAFPGERETGWYKTRLFVMNMSRKHHLLFGTFDKKPFHEPIKESFPLAIKELLGIEGFSENEGASIFTIKSIRNICKNENRQWHFINRLNLLNVEKRTLISKKNTI
jgi:hypothetical protein